MAANAGTKKTGVSALASKAIKRMNGKRDKKNVLPVASNTTTQTPHHQNPSRATKQRATGKNTTNVSPAASQVDYTSETWYQEAMQSLGQSGFTSQSGSLLTRQDTVQVLDSMNHNEVNDCNVFVDVNFDAVDTDRDNKISPVEFLALLKRGFDSRSVQEACICFDDPIDMDDEAFTDEDIWGKFFTILHLWDIVVLTACTICLFLVSLAIAFADTWLWLNVLVDSVHILEFVKFFAITLLLPEIERSRFLKFKSISSRPKGWKQIFLYVSIDFVGSLPVFLILLIFPHPRGVETFRLIHLLRLPRLWKFSTLKGFRTYWNITVHSKFLVAPLLLFLAAIVLHWYVCVDFLLVHEYGYPKGSWVEKLGMKEASMAKLYFKSIQLRLFSIAMGAGGKRYKEEGCELSWDEYSASNATGFDSYSSFDSYCDSLGFLDTFLKPIVIVVVVFSITVAWKVLRGDSPSQTQLGEHQDGMRKYADECFFDAVTTEQLVMDTKAEPNIHEKLTMKQKATIRRQQKKVLADKILLRAPPTVDKAKALPDLLSAITKRHEYSKGDSIYKESDIAKSISCVVDGRIYLSTESDDLGGTVRRYSLIGLECLRGIGNKEREHTAVADSNYCACFELPGEEARKLEKKYPGLLMS